MNKNLLTRITLDKVGDNVSISDEIIKQIKEINEEIDYWGNMKQKYSKYFPGKFLTITIGALVLPIPTMLIAFGGDYHYIFTQHINIVFGNFNLATSFTIASVTYFTPIAALMELPDYIKQLTRKKKINDKIKSLREELSIEQEKLRQLQEERTMQTEQPLSKVIESIKEIDETTTEVHFGVLGDNPYDDSQDYPDETISHDNGNNQSGISLVKKIKR